MRRGLIALVLVGAVLGVGLASAAVLGVTDVNLGSGQGAPATCDSGTPTIVPKVTSTSVASVDVTGIVAGCANGTLQVSVYNGTDPVREGTTTIPAAVTTSTVVNVALSAAVPLKESHFIAVALHAP